MTITPTNPTATAEAFTADGWYKTGDAGRRDAEGLLYLVDRVKDTWQLGPGWVSHVQAELAAGLRDGSSTRGGDRSHEVEAFVSLPIIKDRLAARLVAYDDVQGGDAAVALPAATARMLDPGPAAYRGGGPPCRPRPRLFLRRLAG